LLDRADDRLRGHLAVKSAGYMAGMSYDLSTVTTLRRALDEVLLDPRFQLRKSASALEIAEHLLAQAAAGERNLEKLKSSAFAKLSGNAEQIPNRAA
jgi:hypothetical protein